MTAFSTNTKTPNFAEYVAPIDLNLYAKGLEYKEGLAKENLKEIQGIIKPFLDIQTYGKDAEVLREKQAQLQQEIQGINLGNLSDMSTMAQIRNVINQFSKDEDILNIAKRINFYNKELEVEEEYNKKGIKYRSPSKRKLEEYYNSGIYKTKPNINFSSGWIMPDMGKIMKQAKEVVEPEITYTTDAQGRRQELKRYKPEDLKSAIEQITSSDPNYENEMFYQFEEQFGDTDWDSYSKQENEQIISEAYNNKNLATDLYKKTGDVKYLKLISDSDEIINTYSNNFQNSNSPQETKEKMFQEFKKSQLNEAISAMDAEQRKPLSMDEIKKAQMDLANDWQKIQWQGEKEIAVAKKKAELGIDSEVMGDYLVRPDYDAFQNTINSTQTRMMDTFNYTNDEIQNIGDYQGENPTYLKDKKIIPFTALPSTIQNIFLDFDAVKQSLKKNEKIAGIVVDDSDPTNKKYIPIISNQDGTTFKVSKNAGQDVIVDDNSIKLKTQQVKQEKLPGNDSPSNNQSSTKITSPVSIPFQGDSIKHKASGQILYWDNNTKTYKP